MLAMIRSLYAHQAWADARELAFVEQANEADLSQPFDMPNVPGAKLTNGEAHMQVVMHSQHHRGQCAARLRALGESRPRWIS
jgi:uncharacterized damage-inducible protein DinB